MVKNKRGRKARRKVGPSSSDVGTSPDSNSAPHDEVATTGESDVNIEPEGTSPVPLVIFVFVLPFLLIVVGTMIMNRC